MVRGEFVDLNADTVPDILIVEWHTPHIGVGANPATIDAVLQLNTGAAAGDILLNYPDLVFGNASVDNGASATVGIRNINGAGADPLQISFDSAGSHVTTGNAILISTVSPSTPLAASTNSFSVAEAPASIDVNNGASFGEGTTANVITGTMLISSSDPGDPASELVYTVTAGPTKGTLKLSGSATTTFTQADLNAGLVTYDNDASLADGNDSFDFTVMDDTGTPASGTFSITITEAPAVINVDIGLTIDEGTTAVIDGTMLSSSSDPGDPATEIVYTITSGPSSGTVKLSGVATTTFTQADLNAGLVTYSQDGSEATTDSFNFSVVDDTGAPDTGTFAITITEPPVILSPLATPVTGLEGSTTATFAVATFTHGVNFEDPAEFAGFANINWGDSATTFAGTVTQPGGLGTPYIVSGSHLYTEEGIYNISVQVIDESVDTGFVLTDTATIDDVPVTANHGPLISAVEGGSTNYVLLAAFTDPAGAESIAEYDATVDWGDGSTSDNTTDALPNIFITQISPNHYIVQASHVYLEESPLSGFTVTTTIHHHSEISADLDTVVTQSAIVTDPSVSATGGFHLTAVEGGSTSTSTVATFTDVTGQSPPEATSEYTATIDWGDSGPTSTGTITFSAGTFTVQDSHTYAEEGTYFVSVLLQHGTSPNVTVTSTAVVSDPQITGLIVNPPAGIQEGIAGALTAVATFDDPGGVGTEDPLGDFTASINWGDNTSSTATVVYTGIGNTYQVDVPTGHIYAEEGTYTITVSVKHELLPTLTASASITVGDPAVVGSAISITATENLAFSGVAVATFTDPAGPEFVPDIASHYTASIDWGDGTPATVGTITASGSTFTVRGDHTYGEEGLYTVSTTIDHEGVITVITGTNLPSFQAPNAFGYAAFDQPVQSIDLSTGTGVFTIFTATDDSSTAVALGTNTFNFYGSTYSGASQLFVSSNGLITFGSANNTLSNGNLTSNPAQATIAVLWDDWITGTGSPMVRGQFIDLNADTVPDELIVEWNQVDHFSSSPSSVTFQVVLQLNTGAAAGDILFNYVDLTTGNGNDEGASASVGIKNSNGAGADPLLMSNNSTGPHATTGNAILISTTPPSSSGAIVSDPAVLATGVAVTATEASAFTGKTVATFSDPAGAEPNPADPVGTVANHYTADIDWGDGTPTSAGTITYVGTPGSPTGVFTVAGNHTYAEEGSYTVTTTIHHEAAPNTVVTSTATVADPAVVGSGVAVSATEGAAFTAASVGTFTDPAGVESTLYGAGGAGNFSIIDRTTGFPTLVGPIGFGVTGLAIQPSTGVLYAVATGPRNLITIDPTTGVGTSIGALGTTIPDIAFDPTTGILYGWDHTTNQLATINLVTGLATDVGSPGLGSDFGDGLAFSPAGTLFLFPQGTGNSFYTVDTTTGLATLAGTLSAGPTGAGSAIKAAKFQSGTLFAVVNGDHLVTIDTATGTITDVGVSASGLDAIAFGPISAHYSATINWGDGSPATVGTITESAGTFTVTGGHTYAEEGPFTVTTTVNHHGVITVLTSTATVADAPLTAGALTVPHPVEGHAFSNVKIFHFTDADPAGTASDYTAVVTLGDGNTVTLTSVPGAHGQIVAAVGGGFDVQLSYTYTITLTNATAGVVVHDAGGAFTGASTSTFSVAAPIVTGEVVGTVEGGIASIRAFAADGAFLYSFVPFAGFTGSITVARADFDHDGIPDIVVGAGAGADPRVSVFSAVDGHLLFSFDAFAAGYLGGVSVATGDVNGDGTPDIIVGSLTDYSHVRVFSGVDGGELVSFFAFDGAYHGGVNVAAADINGDGYAEVIVGTQIGSSHVEIFDVHHHSMLASFLAFDAGYTGGIAIAAGDLGGSPSIVVGSLRGQDAVSVFRANNGALLASFEPYTEPYAGGVSVAVFDADGDGHNDIGVGSRVGSHVKAFQFPSLSEIDSFFGENGGYSGGIDVG